MRPSAHAARGAALLVTAALFPAALPAHAQSAGAGAGDAGAPVAALQRALTQLEHSGGSFSAKEAQLAPVVDQAFDLETILRNSIGLRYASIPSDQKTRLLQTFRTYTLANYVSNFGSGNDTFSVSPTTRQSGGDTIVQTAITPPGGTPTRIDYVLRSESGGPRIVDVLVDGTTSRVAVQRSDFRAAFDEGGALGLARTLEAKTAQLSGGQSSP